jgi:hypothetical protein
MMVLLDSTAGVLGFFALLLGVAIGMVVPAALTVYYLWTQSRSSRRAYAVAVGWVAIAHAAVLYVCGTSCWALVFLTPPLGSGGDAPAWEILLFAPLLTTLFVALAPYLKNLIRSPDKPSEESTS